MAYEIFTWIDYRVTHSLLICKIFCSALVFPSQSLFFSPPPLQVYHPCREDRFSGKTPITRKWLQNSVFHHMYRVFEHPYSAQRIHILLVPLSVYYCEKSGEARRVGDALEGKRFSRRKRAPSIRRVVIKQTDAITYGLVIT